MKTFEEIQKFVAAYEEKLMSIPFDSVKQQGNYLVIRTTFHFFFKRGTESVLLGFPFDYNNYPRLGKLGLFETNEYSLDSKRLAEPSLSKNYYPHTLCQWYARHNGRLSELVVHLSRFSNVHFFRFDHVKESRMAVGYSEELESIPQSILGLSEIVGLPIPWQIDYEATVEKMFAGSLLVEVLASL